MPCSECGHLLTVHHEQEDLRCPQCLNLELEDPEILKQKIQRDRELLRDENLLELMQDFDKGNLLLFLIERLNRISYQFTETRQLRLKEFSYLTYLIKIVLPESRHQFGDEQLDVEQDELDERIDALVEAHALLIRTLNQIEDQFIFCVNYPVPTDNAKFLFGDYITYDTEYRYCFHRCLRSLIGGREQDIDLFDKTHEEIRSFERPSSDEIDTLEDFADTFYSFILSLLFIATTDSVIGNIYGTQLPPEVSVFDLSEFFERIDNQFTDEEGNVILHDSTLAWTDENGLNQAGRDVFGDNWKDVREQIVLSEDNLDAHPFLFKITARQVINFQPGRPPRTREFTRIVYPRWYAKLLRFQIFPLLKNGKQPSGHELLTTVSTRRGKQFERKLYDYLSSNGLDCYHSAEIPGVDSSEIDLLVVNTDEDELWFIECKYLMPEILMTTADGIERLNSKFDHKVFNESVESFGPPTGQPFPDKVNEWLNLDTGDQFRWQQDVNNDAKADAQVQQSWSELDPRMLVISNLTPSYVEKQGVQFRTDIELVEMIEDESTVYSIKH